MLRLGRWIGAGLVFAALFLWRLIPGFEPFGAIDFAAIPVACVGVILLSLGRER